MRSSSGQTNWWNKLSSKEKGRIVLVGLGLAGFFYVVATWESHKIDYLVGGLGILGGALLYVYLKFSRKKITVQQNAICRNCKTLMSLQRWVQRGGCPNCGSDLYEVSLDSRE